MTVIPVAYIMAGKTDTVLTSEVGTLATYVAYALVSLAAPVFLAKRRTPKPLTLVLGILGAAGNRGHPAQAAARMAARGRAR